MYCDCYKIKLEDIEKYNVFQRIAQYIEIHCIPQCNAISLYCEESKYSEQYIQQYGVATNSRLLKIVDLFCKRAL